MAEAAGEDNFFLFGLTAEQVAGSRGWYDPAWHYDNEPETRAALDLIFSDHFSRYEPGIFEPLRDALLTHGDHYMHLADLTSYLEADRRLLRSLCRPGGLGAQGHPERGQLRKVLQRPHHCRIRSRDLGCEAVPDAIAESDARARAPTTGRPSPLGATPCRKGVNFSLFSQARDRGRAAAVRPPRSRRSPARAIRLDPVANRTYHYWHVFVPGLAAGQIYGYRVDGPFEPATRACGSIPPRSCSIPTAAAWSFRSSTTAMPPADPATTRQPR